MVRSAHAAATQRTVSFAIKFFIFLSIILSPDLKSVKKPASTKVNAGLWSEYRDSNPRPLGPEPSAIPNFAIPR